MRFTKLLVASAALSLTASHVSAGPVHQDSAKTATPQSQINVLDRRGNCVRTIWENGDDICAPEMAAKAPKPKPIMPASLSKEQTIVYFNFDKANLTGAEAAKLDVVAQALRNANKIVDAKVVGYADPIGTTTYNQNLSQRRVNTVQAYLESKGVTNSEATDVRAMGETSSFSNCGGLRGNALINCYRANRRVEVKFEYK